MNHKLRVLVRLDIDCTAAVVAVTGCLTEINYLALLPIVRRANALINGLAVTVDLTGAKHVDDNSPALLRHALTEMQLAEDEAKSISIATRPDLPVCPARARTQQQQEVAA
ncbi:hypothetical protein GCM10027403_20200 [Arthrobacter tecti]